MYTIPFKDIGIDQVPLVGGKNASLGEMYRNLSSKGVRVPNGFATTAEAYWNFLDSSDLREVIQEKLDLLDTKEFNNLSQVAKSIQRSILKASLPKVLEEQIVEAFHVLQKDYDGDIQVAVRSSATAEDLPQASFAGQQESYLNIENDEELLIACHHCYASLFTARAIKYRIDNGFDHMKVALSVGVQKMVRSDLACSGVGFTLDPETGFKDVVMLSGSYGLGENIVKGAVNPDEYCVFKPSLKAGKKSVIYKRLGEKEWTLVYAKGQDALESKTKDLETPKAKREAYALSDDEIETLARWSVIIEDHYQRPMDIEWAKDGLVNELFIVQARPETVHSQKENYRFHDYKLKSKSEVLVTGKNVGHKIAAGKVRILESPDEINRLNYGEVLVTSITNPDWDPVLKKASAIITDRGGRTSHAAIVARETGAVAVVGTGNATQVLRDGQEVTVSCAEGNRGLIYEGILEWEEKEIDIESIKVPETQPMLILADPEQAFQLSFLPVEGVGLLRLEFAINNSIQVHPMALIKFDELEDDVLKNRIEDITRGYDDKSEFFVEKLAEAVATIAAAFHPKDVIVRMSDFKTNEYANLIGGKLFEPVEENPMLGWRGASRYYHPDYREGFRLECEAMRRVRDDMGLHNVKLMIPFCRTVEEGEKVIALMREYGLKQGENELEVYVMVEIPSNVMLAEEFAEVFDGFSIGSNDLTQLTLGISRDSDILADLFDAQNNAVKRLIASVITAARNTNTKIGLCGQAPSDFPEFAQFLVKNGINSISFSPDAILKGIENINKAEEKLLVHS